MSFLAAGIVFAFTAGGVLLGMWLHTVLPPSHKEPESKEVIKIATGLLATLAALVLGLLVASAKSSFDAQETGFQELAANVLVLDRLLSHCGPEADPARAALRKAVESTVDHLWPANGTPATALDNEQISAAGHAAYAAIRDMSPKDDAARAVQSQALAMTTDLARTRWMLSEQHDSQSSIPFLIVLIFWLTVIYCSFGLFAPRNGIALAVLLLCALSSAGAVFLIVDLNQPNGGLIQVSSTPLRYALSQLGK
ncbi:bestrophin-like domain [Planctomicrobium piriforme]|uniref:DUF4239 domain-containing protein n=1 Tax=Planctomicrobium piriforme TaxID=1576369 RepID=A0A1I3NEK5_9PLAN|nr:hypothetical protein [Planctomicrobium piriforme]SFJ07360.1 hypothetical protein SAMN05421753_11569 [Planctomicrobium piriforme]